MKINSLVITETFIATSDPEQTEFTRYGGKPGNTLA
jgi:hypothetical protein